MLVGQWSEVVTMSKSVTVQKFKTVQECKTVQELKAEMNEKQIISIEGKSYQKESQYFYLILTMLHSFQYRTIFKKPVVDECQHWAIYNTCYKHKNTTHKIG